MIGNKKSLEIGTVQLRVPAPRDLFALVAAEEIAGVDLLLHIVQAAVIAVGNDAAGHLFEFLQVVDNFAAEEGVAVF